MPQGSRTRQKTALASEIVLPPPFTLVTLREVGDAFAHAKALAPRNGAGTLVYVGRFDLCEFAVVLEPDEPLRQARRSFYAGMSALADAIVAFAPPNVPVEIAWPDAVLINGALVGGGRLGWPEAAKEDDVPDWIVFGAMIRTISMSDEEAGLSPMVTALAEEGFTDAAASELVGSFARHLMVATDAWQEHGFPAIARDYLARLPAEQGLRRDIGDDGDLLVRRMGKTETERRKLAPLLAAPSWYDPQARGPKL
jgi:biotin-(acetyl-CoA carboxylase) ligase